MSISFGMCGLGGRDKVFLQDVEQLDWLRLGALCDLNEALLEEWGKRLGVRELFNTYEDLLASDVDFIFLSTPPAVHADMAIQALHAGKPVLCEVPAVASIEEGRALVAAVEETGCLYMMGENFCYRRDIQAFKRFIEAGELGRIIYARGSYCHDFRHEVAWWEQEGIRPWMARYEVPRYITHSLGPLLYVTGQRLERLTAMAPDDRVVMTGHKPVLICVHGRGTNGTIFDSIHSMFVARSDMCFSFTGERGTVESFPFHVDPLQSKPPLLGETPYRLTRTDDADADVCNGVMVDLDPGEPFNSYQGGSHWRSDLCQLAVFAECVRDQKPVPIDVHRALDMSLPGIVAMESLQRGGEPVEVPAL